MMNEEEEILNSGILEQYVLGLLDEEDISIVEGYLEKYPALNNQIKDIRAAMEQVLIQNEIEPPPRLRDQLMSEIEEQNKSSFPRSSIRMLPLLGVLAAIGMVVLALLFFRKNQQRNEKLNDLERQNQILERNYDFATKECEKTTTFLQAEIDYLLNPNTQEIRFEPKMNATDEIIAVHLNNKTNQALLYVNHIPVPPADKQYQLWADVNEKMIDMGVFDAQKTELQEMVFVEGAKSLNITLEPFGGSKEATVTQLMWSKTIP